MTPSCSSGLEEHAGLADWTRKYSRAYGDHAKGIMNCQSCEAQGRLVPGVGPATARQGQALPMMYYAPPSLPLPAPEAQVSEATDETMQNKLALLQGKWDAAREGGGAGHGP